MMDQIFLLLLVLFVLVLDNASHPCSGHRNLAGLARGDSCAQEMLIRTLANTRIIIRSSGIYLGSNRNPSSAKFRLKYSPRWKLPDQEHRRRLWTFGSEKPKYKKKMSHKKNFPVVKSELDWQKELSPDEYHVLRQKGTEMAGTGEYNKFYPKPGEGYFECRACKNPLYSAASKFDSGCGCTYFLFPSPTPNHPRIFY